MTNGLIEKENRRKKYCSIARGTGLFHQVVPGLEMSPCFARVVGGSFPSGVGLPENIEFLKEVPIYRRF